MSSRRDSKAAKKEQAAREQGRTLPHYTAETVKELVRPAKKRKLTPPKRAS